MLSPMKRNKSGLHSTIGPQIGCGFPCTAHDPNAIRETTSLADRVTAGRDAADCDDGLEGADCAHPAAARLTMTTPLTKTVICRMKRSSMPHSTPRTDSPAKAVDHWPSAIDH